ncbi:hypothetical protein [Nonomuraea zeae]|uniref:Uncharacterized protein n=1 Tax=Nonomuraea zeae TaxID=1642303 RepID=A0A5S4GU35_9ACTN|nr:hypothetical protein [Nonomuraea zeae]TMR35984.1 hypothetical protein ETD85_12235 [Nonomuraea zeae]
MGKPDRDSPIDPHVAAKFESDGRVHEPSTMRSIAAVLSKHIEAVEKPGFSGSAMTEIQLEAAQFGEWTDAKIFGATAGRDSAGQKLGQIHSEFVKAYKDVIAAIEASAANHTEADTRNEGA